MECTSVFTILFSLLLQCNCFNVDTDFSIVYNGPPNSHFGVSTEFVLPKKLLLVGASRDNFTDLPDIPYPGNVYACTISSFNSSQNNCTGMENLRTKETPGFQVPDGVYEQREQLLGASTLVPKDSSKAIKICAPKWKNLRYFRPGENSTRYQTLGNCFLLKNQNDISKVETRYFRIKKEEVDQYTDPEIGFSLADYPHPAFETLMGTPNAGVDSRGGVIFFIDNPTSESEVKVLIDKSQLKGTYLPGSYFGYSVAAGTFNNNPFTYVVGAPGFSNKGGTLGAFSVLEFAGPSVNQIKQIEGEQIGSGFGQTLCVDDVNGDRKDDILVGAPLWFYNNTQKNRVLYDIGAVYVYYGTGNSAIIDGRSQILHGSRSQFSRFGTAISGIGDINKDGYNDIAVGAPFEDGTGAVYIFNGWKDKMKVKYSQKIVSSSISSELVGFGYYISRFGVDVDDNLYNDFAVGAYKSSHAVILRSRPIITVRSTINPKTNRVPLNSSLEQCSKGGDYNPCFFVDICLNFTGVGLNVSFLDMKFKADVGQPKSRVEIILDGKTYKESINISEFEIKSDTTNCKNIILRVPNVNRVFFQTLEDPVIMELTYNLSAMTETDRVRAILQENVPTTTTNEARFETGCKSSICQSNLKVMASLDKDKIVVGNDTQLEMNIDVKNSGEPSFKTSIAIQYPSAVMYLQYQVDPFSESIHCEVINAGTDPFVKCTFENPFYQYMNGKLKLRFDVSKERLGCQSKALSSPTFQFDVSVNTNMDTHIQDNYATKVVRVMVLADMSFVSLSSDEQVTSSNKSIQFTHTYTLYNDGDCIIPAANVDFYIPVMHLDQVFIEKDKVMVISKDNLDSCLLVHYPRSGQVHTTPGPTATTSNTIGYNVSDVIVIPSSISLPLLLQDFSENSQNIFCDSVSYKCAVVRCVVRNMLPEDSAKRIYEINFDMLLDNLPELQKGKSFMTYVTQARVSPSADNKVPLIFMKNATAQVQVNVLFSDSFKQSVEEIPLWIILLASLGGLFLFILFGLALWKCGFFERKKRKQVDDFKRRSMYNKRQSRLASVRSARSAAGSMRSHKNTEEHEKLSNKFSNMEDSKFL